MAISEKWEVLVTHWDLVEQAVEEEINREYIRLANTGTTHSLDEVRLIQGRIDGLRWMLGLPYRKLSKGKEGK